MNPHATRIALIIGAVGAALYIAGLVFFALTSCATALPPEPPYTVTSSADAMRSAD
jgi:hypothetical protein